MAFWLSTQYPRFGLLLACAFFSVLFCTSGFLYAQNESPEYDPFAQGAIMHVGFINTDCVKDTVYGFLDPDLRWTPRFICWGRTIDAEGNPLCNAAANDSATTTSRSRQARRLDTLQLIFPDWTRISCAFSVQRYNANDTLDDLFFWLRGADSVGDALVDTSRSLVVFGQDGLDTLASVDLAGIGAFRSSPFYAMELTRGRELVNAKKRDMTRKKSSELVRVDKDVLGKDDEENTGRDSTSIASTPPVGTRRVVSQNVSQETESIASTPPVGTRRVVSQNVSQETDAPEPQIVSAVPGDPIFSVRIYPNPAIYTTNVEVSPLPPGTYTVEIVGVNGAEAWRGEVTLNEEGQIFRTVNLGGLPSGYYVVRIHTNQKIIGTYPIVVVR